VAGSGLLALAGTQVVLIGRGAHLGRLQAEGLRLRLPETEHRLRLPAVSRLAEAHPHGLQTEVVVAKRCRRALAAMVHVPALHLEPRVVELHGHPGPGRV